MDQNTPPSSFETWTDAEKWQYLTRHERLGEVLVKHSRLSIEQLESVLDEQKRTGQHIGQLIIARGLLTIDEILQALERQHLNDKVSLQSIQELQNKNIKE
jgi:ribosomal 50S subunit-associated protein YjgA (DUF615 family)